MTVPLIIAGGALAVLLTDLVLAPRRPVIGWMTAALLAGACFAGASFFDRIFLVAGLLATLGAIDHVAATTPRRQGEYHFLILLSITGMLLVARAHDLLLLVVGFELMGLPLTVLAAWAKTDGTPRSPAAEAALKLYLTAVASTAITLFGLALVVGMSGTTRLDGLTELGEPITAVGMLLVLAGLSFKLGVVPFHMWVPDTYQGAPTPFVAFLSVAPKAAGVAAVAAVFVGRDGPWVAALGVLSLVTMLVGNLGALSQTDVRRMLGYSGVAQMGTVLIAVTAGSLGAASFYLLAYVFANIGVFLVVHVVGPERESFAGLARRSPWLGLALLLFLLSLAGIPFVVGFWAKLYVFVAAARAGYLFLVVAGVVLSVVGLFYYMQLARAAFMAEPKEQAAPHATLAVRVAIVVCVVAVVGMGLMPAPFVP